MKRSLAEMAPDWFCSSRHQGKNGSEMTVFERQQTQMKLLQQQQKQSSSRETQYHDQAQKIQGSAQTQNFTIEDIGLHKTIMMLDHCLGWPEYGHISMPNEMLHSPLDSGNKNKLDIKTRSLTTANSIGVLCNEFTVEKGCHNSDTAATSNPDLEFINESLKKRKMDQLTTQPEVRQILLTRRNSKEVFGETSKGKSRLLDSELAKPDYIQVRARRGQATDRHSLAERVRREKISQKMRLLQDLVPGCNKITGKTGMLDEIINYVQALQSQVEFLSMKLATVTTLNLNNGNTLLSEVLTDNAPKYLRDTKPDACRTNFHSNQIQESIISERILHASSTADLRKINAPAWAHDNFQGTPCFGPDRTWDTEFHALPGSEFCQQNYSTFSSQSTECDSTTGSGIFTMFS